MGLCDSQYGSYPSGSGYFNMNTSRTNTGGWNSSNMRRNILGNTGTPSSPPANTLLAALPADLRAVMKSVTKYSDNTGGGSNTASYVTATTDWLFLLAESEYHGSRSYANSAEQNYQQQYAYYQAGNSKVHLQARQHGNGGLCVVPVRLCVEQRPFSAVSRRTARPTPTTPTIPGPWPPALPT